MSQDVIWTQKPMLKSLLGNAKNRAPLLGSSRAVFLKSQVYRPFWNQWKQWTFPKKNVYTLMPNFTNNFEDTGTSWATSLDPCDKPCSRWNQSWNWHMELTLDSQKCQKSLTRHKLSRGDCGTPHVVGHGTQTQSPCCFQEHLRPSSSADNLITFCIYNYTLSLWFLFVPLALISCLSSMSLPLKNRYS